MQMRNSIAPSFMVPGGRKVVSDYWIGQRHVIIVSGATFEARVWITHVQSCSR